MPHPEVLEGIGVFASLTDVQRQQVASTAREVRFAANQRLFDQGQVATGCWLIQSGHVALDIVYPGRNSLVVQTLGPGDVLGLSWLFPPERWWLGAVATEAVTAIEMDTVRLRTLLDGDPELGYAVTRALLQALLRRLQHTRSRLLDLHGSPRDRHP